MRKTDLGGVRFATDHCVSLRCSWFVVNDDVGTPINRVIGAHLSEMRKTDLEGVRFATDHCVSLRRSWFVINNDWVDTFFQN